MQRGKLLDYKITRLQSHRHRQRGYMMITLMLTLALIAIGLLAVVPEISQQIKRDREEEMRHRGTAYMRAIQHFYKKFGRYPMRLEELENTNNLRFLRKRYKDPLSRDSATGQEKDFKLLHQQDITLNNGPVLGQVPGQGLLGGQGGLPGQGGLSGSGGFPGAPGGFSGMQGGLGGLGGGQPGGLQPNGNLGAQTSGNSSSNTSSNSSDDEENPNSTGSSSSNSNSASPNAGSSASSNSGSGFSGQTFGGGPILGVASTSKAKSIRVFYDKNHYNDWLFIYLSQADMGGLLKGPVNPGAPTTGSLGGTGTLPGQSVMGGQIGGAGLGQGLTPNAGPQGVTPQTPQPPSQTPPE